VPSLYFIFGLEISPGGLLLAVIIQIHYIAVAGSLCQSAVYLLKENSASLACWYLTGESTVSL